MRKCLGGLALLGRRRRPLLPPSENRGCGRGLPDRGDHLLAVSSGDGWLIHTVVGIVGGWGGLRTNRSGLRS